MRWWGRRTAQTPGQASAQAVTNSKIGGDVHQIANYYGPLSRVERALERVAEQSFIRLEREIGRREVGRPAPLSVRLGLSGRRVQVPAELLRERGARLPTRTRSEEIAGLYGGLLHGRLVVLGAPGAGKTVLAMLLARDLLESRGQGDPVPVYLPLSSWSPRSPLDEWMVTRLQEDFRFLSWRGGRRLARRLIASGRVLPILDGLDEVDSAATRVIRRIDAVFGDRKPYVLTCRIIEYEAAVARSGTFLSGAAVYEIEPVKAESAESYLRASVDADRRWSGVLGRLKRDPDGALANALATPLMLYLARLTYQDLGTDPGELLDPGRFERVRDIEEHLLDEFVPVLYSSDHRRPYRAYRGDKAERWLGTLAHSPRELRWWGFIFEKVHVFGVVALTCAAAWVAYLISGPVLAVLTFFLFPIGYRKLDHWILEDRVEVFMAGPHAGLRLHLRLYRAIATLSALAAGVLTGVVVGALLGLGLNVSASTVRTYMIVSCLLFGTVTLAESPWGGYVVTRLALTLQGRLPLRLVRFIEDAHQRGALRQLGTAYRFRHARLQDRLAARHGPSPFRKTSFWHTAAAPSSRLRAVLLPFGTPLLRLAIQVGAIALPAVLLTLLPIGEGVRHAGGAKPAFKVFCDEYGCVQDAWKWRLPPGEKVSTRLEPDVSFRVTRTYYRGFGGEISVKDCRDAVVEIAVRTDRSSRPVIRTVGTHAIGLNDPAHPYPREFKSFTLDFRRVDRATCAARVEWEPPQLLVDQRFRLRSLLG